MFGVFGRDQRDSRRRCLQALAAHDDGHLASIAGKVQGGLRRRVARAHQDDVLVAAKLSFACAGAIIDAGAEQPVLVWQVSSADTPRLWRKLKRAR